MRKRDAAAGLGAIWAMVFLFMTPRGDRIMRGLDRVLFPAWLTGERPPKKPARPILTEDCTGPHRCGSGYTRPYCRESCTMCCGMDVRPCFAH